MASGSEDPQIALDLGGIAGRLGGIVGQLHRRTSVRACDLADEGNRLQPFVTVGIAAAKIIGEVGAPGC